MVATRHARGRERGGDSEEERSDQEMQARRGQGAAMLLVSGCGGSGRQSQGVAQVLPFLQAAAAAHERAASNKLRTWVRHPPAQFACLCSLAETEREWGA